MGRSYSECISCDSLRGKASSISQLEGLWAEVVKGLGLNFRKKSESPRKAIGSASPLHTKVGLDMCLWG